MDSEKVELRAFVIGMSSVLKLHYRKCKIPASLPLILAAAIEAYWQNGSYEGFSKLMSEKVVEVAIKETPLLAAIPDKLYNEKAHSSFMETLYQEIYSFFELCFMDNFRYLARTFHGVDSITVVFADRPCVVNYKKTGQFTGEYTFSATDVKEDER